MKQMGEMQQAQRRIVDMDLKLKSLETSLGRQQLSQDLSFFKIDKHDLLKKIEFLHFFNHNPLRN